MRSPIARAAADRRKRPDRHVAAEHRIRRDGAELVDAGRRMRGGNEERQRVRKRQIGMLRAQHRARRRRRVLAEDHGGGARAAKRGRVFRVGEERDVALAGLLETGDAADLQTSVAFEPAP